MRHSRGQGPRRRRARRDSEDIANYLRAGGQRLIMERQFRALHRDILSRWLQEPVSSAARRYAQAYVDALNEWGDIQAQAKRNDDLLIAQGVRKVSDFEWLDVRTGQRIPYETDALGFPPLGYLILVSVVGIAGVLVGVVTESFIATRTVRWADRTNPQVIALGNTLRQIASANPEAVGEAVADGDDVPGIPTDPGDGGSGLLSFGKLVAVVAGIALLMRVIPRPRR